MAAPFAALEKRVGAATHRMLANGWAVIPGHVNVEVVLTNVASLGLGDMPGRSVSASCPTTSLAAEVVRGTPVTLYQGDQLVTAVGEFKVRKRTDEQHSGQTLLELEVQTQ